MGVADPATHAPWGLAYEPGWLWMANHMACTWREKLAKRIIEACPDDLDTYEST